MAHSAHKQSIHIFLNGGMHFFAKYQHQLTSNQKMYVSDDPDEFVYCSNADFQPIPSTNTNKQGSGDAIISSLSLFMLIIILEPF